MSKKSFRIKVEKPGDIIITGFEDGKLLYNFKEDEQSDDKPDDKSKDKKSDKPKGDWIDDVKSFITGTGSGRFADPIEEDD
jgi:hypothetical protein